MDQNSILDLINDNVYGIWFLVGAARYSLCSAALQW